MAEPPRDPQEGVGVRAAIPRRGALKKPLLVRSSRSEDPCALVYGSLDHLIRPLQERRRDRQAEGLGGLEVDDQFKGCRLLHR